MPNTANLPTYHVTGDNHVDMLSGKDAWDDLLNGMVFQRNQLDHLAFVVEDRDGIGVVVDVHIIIPTCAVLEEPCQAETRLEVFLSLQHILLRSEAGRWGLPIVSVIVEVRHVGLLRLVDVDILSPLGEKVNLISCTQRSDVPTVLVRSCTDR